MPFAFDGKSEEHYRFFSFEVQSFNYLELIL